MRFLEKVIDNATKKRLVENYFSLLFLQGVNFLLPLLTLPYLVHILGIERFGLVMFAQSFNVFFNIIVDFGFNLSATREISVNRDNKEKITEIFSSVMVLRFLLLVFSFLILVGIVTYIPKFSFDKNLYFFTFLMVIGQFLFPIWYFQGLEKMKLVTLISVLSKIIFTILLFIVIKDSQDYLYVPLVNGIGTIVGGIFSLYLIQTMFHQSWKMPTMKMLVYYFKESSIYFLSRVSLTLYTASNSVVLGLVGNNIMVGYYNVASKLFYALTQLYQPVVKTLYPYISKTKNILLFKKVFIFFMGIHFIGVVVLYFYADSIFTFLFSQEVSQESLKVFFIFLFASFFVIPSVFLGYPFLGALGYAHYANKSVIYGSIVHLIGLLILMSCSLISIYSVAFMVLFTEIVVFSLRIYWVKKYYLYKREN